MSEEDEEHLGVDKLQLTMKGKPPDVLGDKFVTYTKEDLINIAEIVWKHTKDVVHTDQLLACIEKVVDDSFKFAEAPSSSSIIDHTNILLANIPDKKDPRVKEYKKQLSESIESLQSELELSEEKTEALLLGTFLSMPDGQITAIALGRWAANGYPQITMGHKFAAALLVTNVAKEVLEQVKPPWDGFVIEVPSGLLDIYDNDKGVQAPIRRIIVSMYPNKFLNGGLGWMYVALTETPISLWRFGVSTEQLLPPLLPGDMFSKDPTMSLELTDSDERVTSMIGRLIINSCLAMSDPTLIQKIGAGHKAYHKGDRREVGEPITRTFQIGKPVKIDFREELKAFIRGGAGARKKLNVQVLVCGHFKGQNYGPKNSKYKIIWREPFWRGPVDAPILVRPHHLEKKDAGTES